jgi:hypothetical protein
VPSPGRVIKNDSSSNSNNHSPHTSHPIVQSNNNNTPKQKLNINETKLRELEKQIDIDIISQFNESLAMLISCSTDMNSKEQLCIDTIIKLLLNIYNNPKELKYR